MEVMGKLLFKPEVAFIESSLFIWGNPF